MTRILQEGRNAWCERGVARSGLLVDGDDYYCAFYAAGQRAKGHILLSGWQFDSDACLLRGEHAAGATLPVTLLAYLNALCERNQDLRIYVLAWDFHVVFALEREWMQDLRFKWLTSARLKFLFDAHHVDGGSHHQKFVVIDGDLSFLGGLDLCDHRWDNRHHRDPNPLRVSRGEPHKPFHDVQAYVVGAEVASELTSLFTTRWRAAGGEPFEPLDARPGAFADFAPHGAEPLAAKRVALSRTDPYGSPTETRNCREVQQLYIDAIAASRRLIYAETQYFSSKDIGAALAERLRAPDSPALEVVLVLNMEAETFKEEVAVGLAQAKVIAELRAAVAGTPHQLGIYYTVPEAEGGVEPERATYIHSKLMIVDDRFLTVGSANLTNRSMGLDTELNLTVETNDPDDELGRSILRARHGLIAEHLGVEQLDDTNSTVTQLDQRARRREGRLRLHPSPTERERTALAVIDPQQLPFDPAAPETQDQDRSIFVGGLGALWSRLFPESARSPAQSDSE